RPNTARPDTSMSGRSCCHCPMMPSTGSGREKDLAATLLPLSLGSCRGKYPSAKKVVDKSLRSKRICTRQMGVAMATDLEQLIDSCLARREARYEDWDTLGFQAKAGDEFRRAQIRYIGSGATGDHSTDTRIL